MKARFFLNILDRFAIKKSNSLLLVRLDGIGDYILFRNFIELLRNDPDYGRYKITLCGNTAWKDLACHFDKQYIDSFLWINRKKFSTSRIYRNYLLVRIHLRRYDLLVQPTFSRASISEDIVREFKAGTKIGSEGDLSNLTKDKKDIYDKMYDRLIAASPELLFEFHRNKEFFENLLGHRINVTKPHIDLGSTGLRGENNPKRKYVMVFVGAGSEAKRWDGAKFAVIVKHLLENYAYDVAISGGREDKKMAISISGGGAQKIHNFAGCRLPELFALISRTELLITNDTAAVHMAALLNKKSICLSNGHMLGRFLLYPSEIFSKMTLLFPKDIDIHKNVGTLCEQYRYGSSLKINDIAVEDVMSQVDRVLTTEGDPVAKN
jgi:ADP-heptose:LPS heptosyltransferase